MKRLLFILKCRINGDTLALARLRWTWECMDEKTRQVFGSMPENPLNRMGRFRAPLRDGDIHHDPKG